MKRRFYIYHNNPIAWWVVVDRFSIMPDIAFPKRSDARDYMRAIRRRSGMGRCR